MSIKGFQFAALAAALLGGSAGHSASEAPGNRVQGRCRKPSRDSQARVNAIEKGRKAAKAQRQARKVGRSR